LEVVLQTHQLVTAGELGDDAGRLRSIRVIVGGRICPPPGTCPARWGVIAELQRWSDL
jgi:hypothetical protein